MSSPTQRTLAMLRKQNITCQVVERWNPYARVRQDLFGIIDILGISGDYTIGIQTTSASNVSARVKKAKDNEALALWLSHPHRKFLVHGWRQSRTRRWKCREVELFLRGGEIVSE